MCLFRRRRHSKIPNSKKRARILPFVTFSWYVCLYKTWKPFAIHSHRYIATHLFLISKSCRCFSTSERATLYIFFFLKNGTFNGKITINFTVFFHLFVQWHWHEHFNDRRRKKFPEKFNASKVVIVPILWYPFWFHWHLVLYIGFKVLKLFCVYFFFRRSGNFYI